tara:strand:+ start:2741 stop:3178 length:438 start_codon:yes stop_codon:yes gene_type:complete
MNNSLDDVFKSIYSSIINASNEIEKHWLGEIKEDYFDEEGHPLTTPIMLPVGEGGSMTKIDIPLIALVPHHGISISEVSIDLKVALSSGDEKIINSKKTNKIRKFITDLSGRNKEMANITVKFKGEHPPEGLARIKDNLIKIIPN